MAWQESSSEEQLRRSVHLNQVLNVVLPIKPLLRNLDLLVTLQLPSAPGREAATLAKATKACHKAADNRVSPIACLEILPFFNLGSEHLPRRS